MIGSSESVPSSKIFLHNCRENEPITFLDDARDQCSYVAHARPALVARGLQVCRHYGRYIAGSA